MYNVIADLRGIEIKVQKYIQITKILPQTSEDDVTSIIADLTNLQIYLMGKAH